MQKSSFPAQDRHHVLVCVCGGEGLFVSFCLGIFFLSHWLFFVCYGFFFERKREKKGREIWGHHERIRP